MTDRVTGEVVRALIAEARHYLTDGGPWRDEVRVAGLVRRLTDALEAVYDAGRRELVERFANQDATRRAAIEALALERKGLEE